MERVNRIVLEGFRLVGRMSIGRLSKRVHMVGQKGGNRKLQGDDGLRGLLMRRG